MADRTPCPSPVSQSDPRTPGHQEKEAVEGDLKESQETLGFVVRAENVRMTQVALPPIGSDTMYH